ncbi:anti-repressor SinI family protein [Bacillus sp. X1(2014)]|nr:anti-repressor SinI family protein [Bacillus sp. X1(2014)]
MSVLSIETTEEELDKEWLKLIGEAKKLGLSIGEIRDFLNLY